MKKEGPLTQETPGQYNNKFWPLVIAHSYHISGKKNQQ